MQEPCSHVLCASCAKKDTQCPRCHQAIKSFVLSFFFFFFFFCPLLCFTTNQHHTTTTVDRTLQGADRQQRGRDVHLQRRGLPPRLLHRVVVPRAPENAPPHQPPLRAAAPAHRCPQTAAAAATAKTPGCWCCGCPCAPCTPAAVLSTHARACSCVNPFLFFLSLFLRAE